MGKKRTRHKRARSSSSSSSTRTPSPPRRRKKVSRDDTETVSSLNNIIPDFDPLKDDINAWLNIVQSCAQTFSWSDKTIRYQSLNKLKGSAKVWYDSLLRTDDKWPTWKWSEWKKKLWGSFQIRRNMFELLREVIDKTPVDNQSLYEFYFEQKGKIDSLCLNFAEQDIISIIVGNISDDYASLDSCQFRTCDELASYLHGRTYKKNARKLRDVHVKTENNRSLLPLNQNLPSTSNVLNQSSSSHFNINQSQVRREVRCDLCGGNHKKFQCELNKCNSCGRKGHLENSCFRKIPDKINYKPDPQETKFVSADSKN